MEAKTLGAVLRERVRKTPNKVVFMIPEGSEFRTQTYAEMWSTVLRYAAALDQLGIARGDRLGLLSENCVEWAYLDWACYCLGVISVPIYPTLPADQVEAILRDAGAAIVIAGGIDQLGKVEGIEGLRTMLLKGPGSLDELAAGLEPHASIDHAIDRTTPEDLATIIYTSGTTGVPKGVMLPHRSFIHVAWSAERRIHLNENDVFLTFLPMSHVYERVVGQALPVYIGGTIGFAKNLASLSSDMMRVRPTIMLGVPRFLEAFRDRAMDGVSKLPPLRQKMFHLAMSQGIKKARGGFSPLAGLLDKIVMGKLREKVGGRLRYFVSGGAALAPHVAEFYMGSGLEVLQGYGLTETAGGSCVNHPGRNRYWTVGEPLDMEIKLASDGEILMRGPGLFLGYWNMPEETAVAIDPEGWFHTGDIGAWEDGLLKITDRKKDILVLGNGKNVAPQPIENKLKTSPYIEEAVLFGDGLEHLIALVVPKVDAVLEALELPENTPVAHDVAVRALLKKEIDRINKTLANYELVKRFAVLENSFTVESGELTPSMKVKRRVVQERYADRLAELHR